MSKLKSKCCQHDTIEYNNQLLCSKCIEYTVPYKSKVVVVFYKVLTLFLFICFITVPILNRGHNFINTYSEEKYSVPSLTIENFFKQINKNDFTKYGKIALAIAQKESGFGTSDLYFKTNNLFGITAKTGYYILGSDGVGRYFKIFNDWTESVDYWCYMIDSRYTSNDKVIESISKWYCPENSQYSDDIKQLIK